ncbi:DUF2971 domain-containing protein [Spirochaetota bacterium]
MYRFRSTGALLDKHNELMNQEIYFPSMGELNDPMEGFKYLTFEGDVIVWKNLISNYLICFNHLFISAYIVDESTEFSADDIPVWKTIDDLETPEYRSIINEILDRFFAEEVVIELLSYINSRKTKIYQDEVFVQLSKLHVLVLYHFMSVYAKRGLVDKNVIIEPNRKMLLDLFLVWKNTRLDEILDSNKLDILYQVQKSILNEIDLNFAIENIHNPSQQKKWFLINAFPQAYLNKIQELAYSNVYVSCFMSECIDPAIWGYYGNGHTGVALRYKTIKNGDNYSIYLHEPNGVKYPVSKGNRRFNFKKVLYGNTYQEINFFTSLGRLPLARLMKYWYEDGSGQLSECYEAIKDESVWRGKYWNQFYGIYCRKLESWQKENEYRLILADSLHDRKKMEQRKFRYDFNDLDAVIFGKKTNLKDKIELINIIKQKCQAIKRTDFNFYQADISPLTGKIELDRLSIIL